jgi:hypothetical protein
MLSTAMRRPVLTGWVSCSDRLTMIRTSREAELPSSRIRRSRRRMSGSPWRWVRSRSSGTSSAALGSGPIGCAGRFPGPRPDHGKERCPAGFTGLGVLPLSPVRRLGGACSNRGSGVMP